MTAPITDSARAIHRVLLATKWGGKVHGGINDYTEAIDTAFVVIPRDELPKVGVSTAGNGFVTALAQSNYQPQLRFSAEAGDKLGEWNRRIAYHNLAVALAVEQHQNSDRERLAGRRNDLARDLLGVNFEVPYDSLNVPLQRAIDRIIDMEDGNQ